MTAKQKAAEAIEQREQLKRHELERVELERSLLTSAATLKATADRKRRDLDFRQLRETFQLREKYGHEIGPGGQSILDGTYKRSRR